MTHQTTASGNLTSINSHFEALVADVEAVPGEIAGVVQARVLQAYERVAANFVKANDAETADLVTTEVAGDEGGTLEPKLETAALAYIGGFATAPATSVGDDTAPAPQREAAPTVPAPTGARWTMPSAVDRNADTPAPAAAPATANTGA